MYVCKEEIFKCMKKTRRPTRGEYTANGILLSLSI